jgi:uncharacterized protein
MQLNEDAELGSGQVEDFRGSGGGGRGGGGGLGGAGIPIPVGGGKLGLIITIVVVLGMLIFGGAFGSNLLGGQGGDQQPDNTSLEQRCARGNPNRFADADCRNWLYITSIQNYWTGALPQHFNREYQVVSTRFFSGGVNTGCGSADSGVGPFYCPADRHVYIDLSFYNELSNRFGASGEFAAPYVLAHEYGHHVQTVLGTEARARQGDASGPESAAVRLELQADCYAGVWANHATETKDPNGAALFKSISEQDIAEAVETAEAIGDDTIQRRSGGRVNPDAFTHGTSEQRKRWFLQGYNGGDPTRCDTFSAANL